MNTIIAVHNDGGCFRLDNSFPILASVLRKPPKRVTDSPYRYPLQSRRPGDITRLTSRHRKSFSGASRNFRIAFRDFPSAIRKAKQDLTRAVIDSFDCPLVLHSGHRWPYPVVTQTCFQSDFDPPPVDVCGRIISRNLRLRQLLGSESNGG